jgi:AcrR family transcriptional regulator
MLSMRERLLSAASTVLTERGVAGATIREIAKAAGVAEGSVYTHFDNKTDLIITVFLERMPKIRLKEAITALLSSIGQGDARVNLRAFATEAIEAYRELDAVAAMLAGDAETAAVLRQELRSRRLGPGKAIETVAAYLRLEEDQGRLELFADPMIVTAALLGACHEHAFQSLFHDESPFGRDAAGFAEALVDGLFRA